MVLFSLLSKSNKRLYRAWVRGFIILYTLFLALGLPFICWGALADPSHPHGGPHFVFATPPAHAVSLKTHAFPMLDAGRLALLESICGAPGEALTLSPQLAAALGLTDIHKHVSDDSSNGDGAEDANGAQPAAQSLPDSLMSLLMLVMIRPASYIMGARRFSRYFFAPLAAPLHLMSVPTPPPRSASPLFPVSPLS